MPEESTTPDLEGLVRRSYEAANRRDLDQVLSYFAPDAVWDLSLMGMGAFEGLAAVRQFCEDWWGGYEQYEIEPEEILDLGNGITFAVISQSGRPVGSNGLVGLRYRAVQECAHGVYVRITNYLDIDEARAAAERLAEGRV